MENDNAKFFSPLHTGIAKRKGLDCLIVEDEAAGTSLVACGACSGVVMLLHHNCHSQSFATAAAQASASPQILNSSIICILFLFPRQSGFISMLVF